MGEGRKKGCTVESESTGANETTEAPCGSSGLRYFKLPANSAHRPFLDLSVTRHAGDCAAFGIEPDGVSATLPVKDTAVLPEMPLQIRQPHAPASSIVSRKARGESSFSASSRWHSRTSFKASRRFALASSTVSPCEIAAGISSTKQVYPPSLAGSKTAVSFILTNYRAQRSVQQAATFSFNSQNRFMKRADLGFINGTCA